MEVQHTADNYECVSFKKKIFKMKVSIIWMLWGIHLFHFFFGLFLVLLMCVCSVMFNSFVTPWTARLLWPWDFSDKNTGVNCHFFLQGIFPTQGLKLNLLWLLRWETDSLPRSHLGSPGLSNTAAAAAAKSL